MEGAVTWEPKIPAQSKRHANLPYRVHKGVIRKATSPHKCFRPTCRNKIEPGDLFVLVNSGVEKYKFHLEPCATKLGYAVREDREK
jgi:hypothetical protein